MLRLALFVIILSCCEGCPLWFVRNDTTNECRCGKSLGLIECDPHTKELGIQTCYCMTYNEETGQTVVGFCLLNCQRKHNAKCLLNKKLPTNSKQEINKVMCSHLNRTGQLCGKCLEGNGLPVYSYSLHCVSCSESEFKLNLFKYIVVAFLPFFYFFVVVFKVSLTSGSMVGYILISQLNTTPMFLRPVIQKKQF